MTSRFVSGGTIASDGAPTPAPAASPPKPQSSQWDKEAPRDGASATWEAVQKELEADRRRREDARRAEVEGHGGEKSLYEVLQANKAAKQAAFEEQNRIRNQFRALDDDELEFLAGVADERRGEEERVRRETEERLAVFRSAQRKSTTATATATSDGDDEAGVGEEEVAWTAARKRKRERGEREKEVKGVVRGVKRRGGSEAEKKEEGKAGMGTTTTTTTFSTTPATDADDKKSESEPSKKARAEEDSPATKPPLGKPKLGLVDYGSDEDEDD
ncbi:N-terminal domain of NEFA-interacting nuclear protein NIP30-domain-containing protein [Whalleya microplaca]|nr:N-terminal domain of NEFA-interacting nuclear protein NIP30-domain-containing protein [Whalleya microplaca]